MMEVIIEVMKIIGQGTIEAIKETWPLIVVTMMLLGICIYCNKDEFK